MERCAMEQAIELIRETMKTMDNTTPEYEECYFKLEDIVDEYREITAYISNWLSYHRPASQESDCWHSWNGTRYKGLYNRH